MFFLFKNKLRVLLSYVGSGYPLHLMVQLLSGQQVCELRAQEAGSGWKQRFGACQYMGDHHNVATWVLYHLAPTADMYPVSPFTRTLAFVLWSLLPGMFFSDFCSWQSPPHLLRLAQKSSFLYKALPDSPRESQCPPLFSHSSLVHA